MSFEWVDPTPVGGPEGCGPEDIPPRPQADPLTHIWREGTNTTWCGIDGRVAGVIMAGVPAAASCSLCQFRHALRWTDPYIPHRNELRPGFSTVTPAPPPAVALPDWESHMAGGYEVLDVFMGERTETCLSCYLPDPALVGPARQAGARKCRWCTELDLERERVRSIETVKTSHQVTHDDVFLALARTRRRNVIMSRLVLYLVGIAVLFTASSQENAAGAVMAITGGLLILAGTVGGRARR